MQLLKKQLKLRLLEEKFTSRPLTDLELNWKEARVDFQLGELKRVGEVIEKRNTPAKMR